MPRWSTDHTRQDALRPRDAVTGTEALKCEFSAETHRAFSAWRHLDHFSGRGGMGNIGSQASPHAGTTAHASNRSFDAELWNEHFPSNLKRTGSVRARHVRKTRLRAETPRSQSGLRLRPRGGIDAAGAAVVCARDAVRCSQTEAESPRDAVGPRGHQRLPPSLPPPLLAASSSLPETGSRGERSYEISTDVSHTSRRGWAGRVAAARV